MIERRGFLTGILALCTAPAIVRAGSIMPVKVMPSVNDVRALIDKIVDYEMEKMVKACEEAMLFGRGPFAPILFPNVMPIGQKNFALFQSVRLGLDSTN